MNWDETKWSHYYICLSEIQQLLTILPTAAAAAAAAAAAVIYSAIQYTNASAETEQRQSLFTVQYFIQVLKRE